MGGPQFGSAFAANWAALLIVAGGVLSRTTTPVLSGKASSGLSAARSASDASVSIHTATANRQNFLMGCSSAFLGEWRAAAVTSPLNRDLRIVADPANGGAPSIPGPPLPPPASGVPGR